MAYSQSDLKTSARRIDDARTQVDALTADIMDARRAGRPVHLLESALIMMLHDLERMIRYEQNIRATLAKNEAAPISAGTARR
jgi:hypothetical protein